MNILAKTESFMLKQSVNNDIILDYKGRKYTLESDYFSPLLKIHDVDSNEEVHVHVSYSISAFIEGYFPWFSLASCAVNALDLYLFSGCYSYQLRNVYTGAVYKDMAHHKHIVGTMAAV